MPLPQDIKKKIANFVAQNNSVALCTWLAQPATQAVALQYITDPEFAEIIIKNNAFAREFFEWLLMPNRPQLALERLQHFLYLCIRHKIPSAADLLLQHLTTRMHDPNALAARLANMHLARPVGDAPTHDIPDIVLKLLHIYSEEAYLGLWQRGDNSKNAPWYNRDQDLANNPDPARAQAQVRWLKTIVESIFLLYPILRPYFNKQDFKDDLIKYYYSITTARGQYFSDDYSDDSDSDDETLISSAGNTNTLRRNQLLRKQEITQQNDFHYETKTRKIKTRSFAQQTRRLTKPLLANGNRDPKDAGLESKIAEAGAVTEEKVAGYIKNLKTDTQDRPTLSPIKPDKIKFVAQYRGLNYMYDRWSNESRRFHYKLNEVGFPQLSESILKLLPFDIYTELNPSQNYIAHVSQLAEIADNVNLAYQNITRTGFVVEPTFTPNGSDYLFNHRGDFLQQRYSNGISAHLFDINQIRTQRPEMQTTLLNSYNYGISTANRYYHAGKYASGLKEYYPHNFKLYYDTQGRLLHAHGGKVYIALYTLEEFLQAQTANRVLQSLNQGRTPILQRVILELETTFIGRISAQNIVHQEIIKYPSFHKPYKEIYAVKYGLSPELYRKFKFLLQGTRPETKAREKVNELISEWLCAYFEALLTRMAEQYANDRNGTLVYIDHENTEQIRADSSPLTGSGGHLHDRNRLHVLQNLRWLLGKHFKKNPSINPQDIANTLEIILRTPELLKEIYDSHKDRKGVELPEDTGLNKQGAESQFYQNVRESLLETVYLPKKLTRDQAENAAKEQITLKIIRDAMTAGVFTQQTIASSSASKAAPKWQRNKNIIEANHLYEDHQIDRLLQHYLQPLIAQNRAGIFAAQHPMITGPNALTISNLFQTTLSNMLITDQTTIMPVNTTPEYVSRNNLPGMAGTHWVGLVARTDNGVRRLFYIDPLNNPIPAALQTLIDAERGTIELINVSITQQGADLDCGAWTVDNLRRLALAPQINSQADAQAALRAAAPGAGLALRQEHAENMPNIYIGANLRK